MTATPAGPAPRSWLFVPGDRADRWLAPAVASGAEAIILDLEDGVAPAARAAARDTAGRALAATQAASAGDAGPPVYVRVNRPGSEWWRDDVAAAALAGAAGVVVPKCERVEELALVSAAWADATDTPLRIVALLESPAGVLAAAAIAAAIAGANDAVVGLALGAEDLAASAGLIRSAAGDEILVARSLVALAAAASGRWAIDTPCLELDDLDQVEADTRRAAALGFGAKLALNPRQIGPIHRGFRPTDAAVAEARAVLAAADGLAATGQGVGRTDGRMVDAPVVAAAREVVRRWDADGGGR